MYLPGPSTSYAERCTTPFLDSSFRAATSRPSFGVTCQRRRAHRTRILVRARLGRRFQTKGFRTFLSQFS